MKKFARTMRVHRELLLKLFPGAQAVLQRRHRRFEQQSQNDLQSSDIQAIIDAHEGRVHNQEVGPLFGHLAMLARELRRDAVTRSRYQEGVAAALASDACQQDGPALVWTHLLISR